ncbi:MAG TPA: hypothetical protein VIV60_13470 [Polyangiaceae bacterium]
MPQQSDADALMGARLVGVVGGRAAQEAWQAYRFEIGNACGPSGKGHWWRLPTLPSQCFAPRSLPQLANVAPVEDPVSPLPSKEPDQITTIASVIRSREVEMVAERYFAWLAVA